MRFVFALALASLLSGAPGLGAQAPDALQSAVAAGEWQRAASLAQTAVAADRHNATAWTYLGLAEDHLGHKPEALRDFAEAVRLAPDATFAHNNYGASLETSGRTAQAAAEYRRSLALDGHQPAAMVNLARLEVAGNTPQGRDEARRLLQTAWQLAPDAEIAGSLLLLAPCAAKREALSPEAGKAPEGDLSGYAHLLAADPDGVPKQEQEKVSDALLACGLGGEAEQFDKGLLASAPHDPQRIVALAQAELASGRPQEAGATLERAVAGGVEAVPVYVTLVQVYEATGHINNAVAAMQRALSLAPQDEALQFRYGMLLLDAHAPKAAAIRMQQAVERTPRAARLWFALGLAQFDQTQPELAQTSFNRAIALDPRFAPALAYRGLAALDQQHYKEAELWYRKAIAADPHAADLHCLLAEALERQRPAGNGEIRAELAQALALDPKLGTAYLSLGRLDLEDGKPADAARALETALQLDPKQMQAHFYLARAYRQMHEPERAATEGKLFSEQQAAAQEADRAALQAAARQLAHTNF